MNSPSQMPARIVTPRGRLDDLIDQATITIHAYLSAGLSEDTALALTDITLDRYDQEA